MNKYIYTLTIEFESNQPIQEERLDLLDTFNYATSEHIEQIMMHRRLVKLKETIEHYDNSKQS